MTTNVNTYLSVLERGKADVLIHDGKYGPTVLRPGGGSAFACMYGVVKSQSNSGEDVELIGPSRFTRDKTAETLRDAIGDFEIERVPKKSSNKPWVFNLFANSGGEY